MKDSSFVVAICPKSGKLLMGRNQKKQENWEFFGGCARKNESPGKTAQREFKEETGIRILKERRIFSTVIYCKQRTIRVFVAPLKQETEVKLGKEHSESGWFLPDKLPSLTTTAKKILKEFFIMNSRFSR